MASYGMMVKRCFRSLIKSFTSSVMQFTSPPFITSIYCLKFKVATILATI